jgi:hypothetical protein
LITVGGKLKPSQILDLVAAAPRLTTLYLPRVVAVTPDIMKLLKDKIAAARGSGGKSLVRELVVQSVSMASLHALGDVFPEVERLGIFKAASWFTSVVRSHVSHITTHSSSL